MSDNVVKFPGSLRPGRWYHCWLRHMWGPWANPKPYTFVRVDLRTYDQMGQERFCQVCNKRQVRHA